MSRRLAWLIASAVVLLPMSAAAQDVVEYYGTDALGSVRIVFDVNGNVVGRMDYGPFGEQVTVSTVGHKSFAGLFRDGEAGLDYAEARSYQVRTGRFNAPDPVYAGLFAPQGWNRYAYALNNPVSFTDPSGEQAQANCGSVVQTGEGESVFRIGITCDGGGGGGASWNLSLFNLSSPIFFDQRGTGSGRQEQQGGGRGRTRGSTTPTAPAPPTAPIDPVVEPQTVVDTGDPGSGGCSSVPSITLSVGPSATAGANLLFGVPFLSAGLNVGIDVSTGQVGVTVQGTWTQGVGIYGGGGVQGGIAYSPSGTQSGFSTQTFGVVEGNYGWGPSAGASVNVSRNGIAGGKGVLPRVGAGYGFMAGAGAGGSATYVFNDPLWCK